MEFRVKEKKQPDMRKSTALTIRFVQFEKGLE
jgi:hypothetical protein